MGVSCILVRYLTENNYGSYKIRAMTHAGAYWKWPEKLDDIEYLPEEIIQLINTKKLVVGVCTVHSA